MARPSEAATMIINEQHREINKLRRKLRDARYELRAAKARANDLSHIVAVERSRQSEAP